MNSQRGIAGRGDSLAQTRAHHSCEHAAGFGIGACLATRRRMPLLRLVTTITQTHHECRGSHDRPSPRCHSRRESGESGLMNGAGSPKTATSGVYPTWTWTLPCAGHTPCASGVRRLGLKHTSSHSPSSSRPRSCHQFAPPTSSMPFPSAYVDRCFVRIPAASSIIPSGIVTTSRRIQPGVRIRQRFKPTWNWDRLSCKPLDLLHTVVTRIV